MSDWPLSTIRDISAEIERMYAALETLSLPDVQNAVDDGTLPEVPPAETAHAQAAAAIEQQTDQPALVADGAQYGVVLAGNTWSQ
jgi:hypothetical protein